MRTIPTIPTVAVYPADVRAASSKDMTIKQAQAFLAKHEDTIREAMVTAANGAIADLIAQEEESQ